MLVKLLGSKTLGTKCIRTSMCNVLANHDQNLESRFRLLKVCLFVKLESSELHNLLAKSARLDRSKIRLDVLCFESLVRFRGVYFHTYLGLSRFMSRT